MGGAAGDALGYAVEFMSTDWIYSKYGKNGITEYDLKGGVARISDDTQMTLFTANGLLIGKMQGNRIWFKPDYAASIKECYTDWLNTQFESYPLKSQRLWLANIPELFQSRAPGNTCLSAISMGCSGTVSSPINNSKGCGGVMRVAPIGLYKPFKSQVKNDMLGAEAAALTHGHELGYIPAAALVHIISLVVHNDSSLLDAVNDSISATKKLFPNAAHLGEFVDIMNRAVELSKNDMPDLEAIELLGEGWVAEECLAIAVYCALRYEHDFDKALITSVNHSGDNDSTGAVTGNILGAYLGMKGIPQKYLDKLEFKDIITEIADDLFNCSQPHRKLAGDKVWVEKYVKATYKIQ